MSRVAPSDHEDREESREERRRRYEAVLSCVAHNQGWPDDPQTAGARRIDLHLSLADHGPFTVGGVERSIAAARQNGDLIEFKNADGYPRLARTTNDGLRKVRAEQASNGIPNRELFNRVNGLLEVTDDG